MTCSLHPTNRRPINMREKEIESQKQLLVFKTWLSLDQTIFQGAWKVSPTFICCSCSHFSHSLTSGDDALLLLVVPQFVPLFSVQCTPFKRSEWLVLPAICSLVWCCSPAGAPSVWSFLSPALENFQLLTRLTSQSLPLVAWTQCKQFFWCFALFFVGSLLIVHFFKAHH